MLTDAHVAHDARDLRKYGRQQAMQNGVLVGPVAIRGAELACEGQVGKADDRGPDEEGKPGVGKFGRDTRAVERLETGDKLEANGSRQGKSDVCRRSHM